MTSWKDAEDEVVRVRTQRCNEAIAKLIGGDPSKNMPRVGICLSGGGWRAMTSSCAFMDALSTPLAPSETVSNTGGIKLLDTVSHAFGLSGGSWALFTTLAGGSVNPFHQSLDPSAPPVSHPWLYGQQNAFDENVHVYDGLAQIVSQDTVDRACYRSRARQRIGFLSHAAGADTTIAAAMVSDRLGNTLVERWSNFIANDILRFVDARQGVPPPALPVEDPASNGGTKAEVKAQDAAILRQAQGNPSRNVDLSAFKDIISRGDLPFMVCSAIANRPKVDPTARSSPFTRAYDWVEFTPWYARNGPQGIVCDAPNKLKGFFEGVRTGDTSPLKMHNLMAICGSAFACDVACALPAGVSALVQKHVMITSEPILGGGVTDVVVENPAGGDDLPFGICRDAGIDFNVPLPPMLAEAGRSFDVIVVHDAGAGSKNAFELQRAIDLGYLKLMPGSTNPLEEYAPGERVRVFRGAGGCPSVIYFLGLTERGTHQIVQSVKGLQRDVRALRETVIKQLLPVILGELRVAKARLDHGTLASVLPPPPPKLAVVRTTQTRRTIALDAEEQEEADALNQEVAQETTKFAHPLKPLAESLVVNAMTQGRVNDIIDAYMLLEHALFGSLPQTKRLHAITTLEERSIKTITLPPDDVAALAPVSTILDAPELCEVLVEFGVLDRVHPADPLRKEANLSQSFVDFYAATALLAAKFPNSSLLGREGFPPSASPDALNGLPWRIPQCPGSKVWNMVFVGMMKLQQLPMLADLVKRSLPERLRDDLRSNTVDGWEAACEGTAKSLVDACEDLGTDKVPVLQMFADACSAVHTALPADGALEFLTMLTQIAAANGRTAHLYRVLLGVSKDVTSFTSPFKALAGAQRERCLALVSNDVSRNPSDALRDKMMQTITSEYQFTITFHHCCEYALDQSIKAFVPQHLDDRGAVSAILDTKDRHAMFKNHLYRAACVEEIWMNGVASNIFRDWIVEECVNKHQRYWMFLAPRVREVKVPENASEEVAQEAVSFAEKCKRLQLINIPQKLAHDLRSRVGHLEAKLRDRKDEIAGKIVDAASLVHEKAAAAKLAAASKVSGLMGKFGF